MVREMKISCFSQLSGFLMLAFGSVVASASDDDLVTQGLTVYKKANCVGCHKWHGGGGGGYGGSARSLRETALDDVNLAMLIRCGRPGTGMPFHSRNAYKGKEKQCYGSTLEAFGDAAPPRARTFIRDAELDAVVAYVLAKIKGQGEPTVEQCNEFWGPEARECQE